MNATRLWVIAAVALSVGVALAAWFAGIQPRLLEVARAESDRVNAVALNQSYELALIDLKAQFETIGEVEDQLALLQRAVPFTLSAPSLLQELNGLATATAVTLDGITMGEARAYGAPPVAPVAQPVPPEGDAEASEEPAPEPVAVSAATAPSAPAPVTDPRITAANFVAVPLTITVSGNYASTLGFVRALQSSERLVLVTGVSLAPADGGIPGADSPYTCVISAYTYVLLDPIADAANSED